MREGPLFIPSFIQVPTLIKFVKWLLTEMRGVVYNYLEIKIIIFEITCTLFLFIYLKLKINDLRIIEFEMFEDKSRRGNIKEEVR
jgi:hypothetical protein